MCEVRLLLGIILSPSLVVSYLAMDFERAQRELVCRYCLKCIWK